MSQKSNKEIFAVSGSIGLIIVLSITFFTAIHNIDNAHNFSLWANQYNMEKCPTCWSVYDMQDCNNIGCKHITDQYMQGMTIAMMSFVMLIILIFAWGMRLWKTKN